MATEGHVGLTHWIVYATSLLPQTGVHAAPHAEPPCLVLRVSKDWVTGRFEQCLPDEFDVGTDLSAGRVTGRAVNQGQADMRLDTSGEHPALVLTYQGVTRASLSGQSGIVSMRGRTTTTFVASRRITFDGRQFAAGDTDVSARTSLTIDQVNVSRRGLLGSLARRIGLRTLERNKPQTNAQVSRFAQDCLEDVFAAAADRLLVSLNETTCLEQVLLPLPTGQAAWGVRLTESDDHLLLTFASLEAPPADLPPVTADSPAVEIWLQVPEYQSRLISAVASSNRACDLLRWALGDHYATLSHLSESAEVTSQGRWTRIASGRRVPRR